MSELTKIETLLTAAQHLEDELQRLGQMVDAACWGNIGSQKAIERTAKAIAEATGSVGLIDARAQARITTPLAEASSLEVDFATPIALLKERLKAAREGARTPMQESRTMHFEEMA